MEPVRILQVFTILNRGGAETNIMNYYRKIDRTKFQFDFLVHRNEIGVYEDEITQLGGKIFRLPAINPFKLLNYKKKLKLFFDNNNNYNIIHGHSSELGFYIYKEAHRRKIAVVIAHSHNTKDHFDYKLPFRIFWKKRMIKYLNAYFSCGQQAGIYLFGKEKSKEVFIMTNAIETSDFVCNAKLEKANRLTTGVAHGINIVNTARFNSQKNHKFLIDIFYELNKISPEYSLFLVGDGILKKSIIQKVHQLNLQKKVVFLGSRKDVNIISQAMDIFLLPSLFEGLPVSLIEAQAAGLKCVISNKVPPESILINENVTVVSLKNDAKVWANEIFKISDFRKQNLSNRIIDAGYDINTNVKILENKYLELLKNNSIKP